MHTKKLREYDQQTLPQKHFKRLILLVQILIDKKCVHNTNTIIVKMRTAHVERKETTSL